MNQVELSQIMRHTIDVDSHEMAPVHEWGAMFGENSARLAEAAAPMFGANLGANSIVRPGLADCEEISEKSVWTSRGAGAPGAFDFDRRIQVLDVMGIDRQLVFPTSALHALHLLIRGERALENYGAYGLAPGPEVKAMLWGVIREYNDWVLRTSAKHARYRAATVVFATGVEDLMAQARKMIESGARALWLPSGVPLAGLSPADHALGPFWSLLEESNVVAALHLGGDFGFRATDKWADAKPEFEPIRLDSAEITFDPFTASTVQIVPINFVSAMVMGGVFERHPRLRFGAIEVGSSWLGPLAEHLDIWAAVPFKKRMASILTMPPSAYIARNVRVTPFYFEPIDLYLSRHSTLQDCYCYSTDYPHMEGGLDVKARYFEKVAPLGDEVMRKFFVSNGEWLLPN